MFKLFSDMSLMSKGLKYKTMIAFSLMSLIPLLICFWLVTTFIFPNLGLFFGVSLGNISFILFISIFLSLLGFYVTKQMIDPLIKMAGDAKDIAGGNISKVIEVECEDEIGDIGASLNMMTQKIKENIEELRIYGEKTKLINLEINKKVFMLSSLLHIGNLISAAAELETVMDFIAQKVADVEDGSSSFVALLDEETGAFNVISSSNVDQGKMQKLGIKKGEIPAQITVVDKNKSAGPQILNKILAPLDLKNIVMLPIIVSKVHYGFLAMGNNQHEFMFSDDTMELLTLFVKQAAIAVENDLLIKRTKELAVQDELTGLYNESFITKRLDEEIRRAVLYQRPCGFLLIDIDGFKKYQGETGEAKANALLKSTAEILKGAVTEVDKIARLELDRFAIVLPERNKKQAANIAEEIRKKVEDGLGKAVKICEKITVSIGVSENPIDGSSAEELLVKAEKLLKSAKSLGKNRVAV